MNDTLSDPFRYVHITRAHKDVIDVITSNASRSRKSGKRKRAEVVTPNESPVPAEVVRLREYLDSVQLKCWPYVDLSPRTLCSCSLRYPVDAALFIRPPKSSDLNVLAELVRTRSTLGTESLNFSQRRTRDTDSGSSSANLTEADAILTVSIYNRLTWGNHLVRSSQHAVLASQTLGDLYEAIPCTSNEIPLENRAGGETTKYDDERTPPHHGAVICIEGVGYGDGQAENDYSELASSFFFNLLKPNTRLGNYCNR